MYSVRQQRPPSVRHLSTILDVDHRAVLLSCRGVLLDATLLEEHVVAPTRGPDLGDAAEEPALLPPPSVSICVGATPLSMVACALNCMVLLTEDNGLVVLRVHLPPSIRGAPKSVAADSNAEDDREMRLEILLNTPVPMEAVVNRPPTTEHASPLLCTNASRSVVYLQVYRGWMHVVKVAHAATTKPLLLSDVVSAVQLETATLRSVAVLPEVTNGIVPVLDRHLPTVKGLLVTESPASAGGTRLTDAMRRWMLPGTPHFAIALSKFAVPLALRGTAAARDLVAFAVEHPHPQYRLMFAVAGSASGKRDNYPYEVLPDAAQIVAGVELVPPLRSQVSPAVVTEATIDTLATSVLWLLTAKGELLRGSYANATAGDCEDACASRIYLHSAPRDRVFTHIAVRPALPTTVVVLGDGMSVFLIDPWSLTVVRWLPSTGPVVAICDGPRNSLVSATVRGEISVTQQRLQCETVVDVELEGVAAVFAWHALCKRREPGDSTSKMSTEEKAPDDPLVFLVCRGHPHATTTAFVLDHDGLEEVGDGEVAGVARFDAHADTLAVAAWRNTSNQTSAVHVSSTGVTLSVCDDLGAFSVVWCLPSAEPLVYASIKASSGHSGFCFAAASAGRLLRCARLSANHSPEWVDVVLCHNEIACVAACATASSGSMARAASLPHNVALYRIAYATWNDLDVYVAFVPVIPESGVLTGVGASISVVHSGLHPTRSLIASERCREGVLDLWMTDAVGGCFRFPLPDSPNVSATDAPASAVSLGRYALPLVSPVAQSSAFQDAGAVVIFSGGEAVLVVEGDGTKSGSAPGGAAESGRGSPIIPAHTATYDTLDGRNDAVVAGAAWSTATPGTTMHLLLATPTSLRILRAPLLHRVPWCNSTRHPVPTREVVVRSVTLPSVVDAGADVVAMISCGGHSASTPPRHGPVNAAGASMFPPPNHAARANVTDADMLLLILVNTLRGSLLTLLSCETLAAKDAVYLQEQEFAIGMEACCLHETNDLAVLATGLCKLVPPSDPQSGRVLVVSVSPLRVRASYVTEREAPYCVAHFTTAAFSDEVELFVVVGMPSRVAVLRLVGDSVLQPVAACAVNTPPTAVSVSMPYIAVSELAWGTEYFEFTRREPQVTAASATQTASAAMPSTSSAASCPTGGLCAPAVEDPATAFRLLPRCTEAFANSATTVDRSYSKNRFVRACLRRNVHLVALEPQDRHEAPPAEDDAGGATGITTSPIVPVCVGGVRLTGRVLGVHVTTKSHAPMLFSPLAAPPNPSRDSGRGADATPAARRTEGSGAHFPQRGLRTWNFNSAFEPNFTVAPTAPRVLLSCDDGSLYLCCGIPAELSRLLIRLETSIVARFLDPESAVCGRPLDSTRKATWVWGADRSVASYSSVASVRSLARTAAPHGFVNLSIVDLFLTHLTEEEQQALCSSEEVARESSDEISVAALRALVASLVLLE